MFVFFVEYFLQKNKHTTLAELAQASKADYFKVIEEYNEIEYSIGENAKAKATKSTRETIFFKF